MYFGIYKTRKQINTRLQTVYGPLVALALGVAFAAYG